MNLIETAKAAIDLNFLTKSFVTGGNRTPNQIIISAIDILLWVSGILAIIYLIYSGILYLTAAGNPDSAKKGQQGLVNAIIGIVIIVLAYVIARTIANAVISV